jgi:hypothetical protein
MRFIDIKKLNILDNIKLEYKKFISNRYIKIIIILNFLLYKKYEIQTSKTGSMLINDKYLYIIIGSIDNIIIKE